MVRRAFDTREWHQRHFVHGRADKSMHGPTAEDRCKESASKCIKKFLETGVMSFLPSRPRAHPRYANHDMLHPSAESLNARRTRRQGVGGGKQALCSERYARPPAFGQPGFREFARAHNLWVETGTTPASTLAPRSSHLDAIEREMQAIEREIEVEHDLAWARAREREVWEREQVKRADREYEMSLLPQRLWPCAPRHVAHAHEQDGGAAAPFIQTEKMPAQRPQLRVDPADGNAYPRDSFLEIYGEEEGQRRWATAGQQPAKVRHGQSQDGSRHGWRIMEAPRDLCHPSTSPPAAAAEEAAEPGAHEERATEPKEIICEFPTVSPTVSHAKADGHASVVDENVDEGEEEGGLNSALIEGGALTGADAVGSGTGNSVQCGGGNGGGAHKSKQQQVQQQRVDRTDGKAYPLDSFIECYGEEEGRGRWMTAASDAAGDDARSTGGGFTLWRGAGGGLNREEDEKGQEGEEGDKNSSFRRASRAGGKVELAVESGSSKRRASSPATSSAPLLPEPTPACPSSLLSRPPVERESPPAAHPQSVTPPTSSAPLLAAPTAFERWRDHMLACQEQQANSSDFPVTAAWGSTEERKNVLDAVLAVLDNHPECDAAEL